jgi:hypothetical protein
MDADAARSLLLAQHDRIHVDLNRCCSLAQRLRIGEPLDRQLDMVITQLRANLALHNATESKLIGPLLHNLADRSQLHLKNMLEQHLTEHNQLLELLAGPVQEVAMRMVEIARELEAHIAAEERSLLCRPPGRPAGA